MADEHVSRSYMVENTWKCGACGHVNQGRDLKCQNCGATKGKSDADQTAANAPEVTDASLLAMANAGANWVCPFCGSQTRNSDGTCKNCGAGDKEGPRQSLSEKVSDSAPSPPVKSGGSGKAVYFIVGGVVVVGVLGVLLFAPHKVGAKVSGVRWEYDVDVQQRTLLHGSGYDVPAGAIPTSCQDRTTSEKQDCNPHDCNCHDKKIDKGNGFTQVQHICSTCYDKCDKSVVRRWCNYDYYDWRVVSSAKESGEGHDVKWPPVPPTSMEQRLEKHERYSVVFEDGKQSYTYSPSNLGDFERYSVGATWKIKVNAAKMVTPEAQQ